MKKVISIMCIVLMVLGIILPQISYANELQENIIQNEKVENNTESNGDENKEESNTVENVIDNQEMVEESQNTIEDEITDETTENVKEEINNEEEKVIEPESTQDNVVKSIEAGSLKLAEGIYTIRSVLPGNRAVGIDAGSKEDGANVNIWDYYGVGQQKFRLRIDSEGYYEIE
ncbi:MAG: RICIN domain-containing protein, partial [Clostridium sp.]|nr:RICIN domain-containing protein [Clostridium sp.]